MGTGVTEHIAFAVDNRIATITLDRPERLNAFTPQMQRELVAAIDATDADDDVRAIVVTGAGRAFCAGADLSGGLAAANPAESDADLVGSLPRDGGGVVSLRIAASLKPVIGAINGVAVGVGLTMTLPMDVRIAARSARFALPYARRGIAPEAASSWFLPRVVGIARAMEWAVTGRLFGAEEALSAGLVSRVVDDDAVLETAFDVAREVVSNTSAVSVAATRRMLWSMLGEPSPWTAHYVETHVIAEMKTGGDPAEGAASFLEKRAPAFPMQVSTDMPPATPAWPARPADLDRSARDLARGSADQRTIVRPPSTDSTWPVR
jgi:enoyl-CoA hydratase/carnithine racemase